MLGRAAQEAPPQSRQGSPASALGPGAVGAARRQIELDKHGGVGAGPGVHSARSPAAANHGAMRTKSHPIIARCCRIPSFPRLARLELRPGNDLAGGSALRVFPGAVELPNGILFALPWWRRPSQPRRRRLYGPWHWRAPHPARLLHSHRRRPVVHGGARLLDAARRPACIRPRARRVLAGELGDGERARPARAACSSAASMPPRTGQIVGTTLCGFLLAAVGFQSTFAVLAWHRVIAFIAGLGTLRQDPKPASRTHVLAAYLPLLRERIIAYAGVCAYVSALPFALHVVLSGAARALRLRRGRIRGAARASGGGLHIGEPGCGTLRPVRAADISGRSAAALRWPPSPSCRS